MRHSRAIRADAYERADGLWDIEACVTDVKPRDTALASGVRPNGLPIHELWLRITIDRKLNVVDAEASSAWVPYPGLCEASNSAYRALIGLNLLDNFRRHATRLLGGTVGCTHLTELCAVLPSAAIQAFAGEVWNTAQGSPGEIGNHAAADVRAGAGTHSNESSRENTNDKPPFQLGRCHTLRFDGEAVRQFYPRWYGHAPRSLQPREVSRASASAAHAAAEETAGKEVLSNSQD
ncbi:Protein of unknown function (DUF2889) [Paraburkholderia rhizosphaerae]|uniref:DUF2889 family protein n=1 Tax=Paraburkholderia rhizosphaerae TaxID=480658 RepID=A0A4R8LY54_9BURK|nr:Protein of unknown function (DUF2889) [Paraburkholderia rhizosphaerae]